QGTIMTDVVLLLASHRQANRAPGLRRRSPRCPDSDESRCKRASRVEMPPQSRQRPTTDQVLRTICSSRNERAQRNSSIRCEPTRPHKGPRTSPLARALFLLLIGPPRFDLAAGHLERIRALPPNQIHKLTFRALEPRRPV